MVKSIQLIIPLPFFKILALPRQICNKYCVQGLSPNKYYALKLSNTRHCLKGKKLLNLVFTEAGCQGGTAGAMCHQKITGELKSS